MTAQPKRREPTAVGIPVRLLLLVVLTVAPVVGGFGVWEYFTSFRQADRELQAQADSRATRLAQALHQAVKTGALDTVRDTAQAELSEPLVAQVTVRRGARVLFAARRRPDGTIANVTEQGAEAGDAIRATRPIGDLGSVGVALSKTPGQAAVQGHVIRHVLEFLVLSLLLLVTFSLVIQRYLVRPLEQIRQAMNHARRFVGGDSSSMDSIAEVARNPVRGPAFAELHAMGESFKQMVLGISERRRALEASEENLRITVESLGEGVIATDSAGRITRMNRVASKLTGYDPGNAEGKTLGSVLKMIDATTRESLPDPAIRAMTAGVQATPDTKLLVASDGSECPIEESGAPIRDARGRMVGAVVVFRDVTEKNRLEEQLRHAQRMDSIGQLAGGVAHDFNNMLTGILGNAELLEDLTTGDPEAEEYVSSISATARRAADLTRKLLTFSHKGEVMTQPVHVHRAIKDTVALLERSIDKRIEIKQELGADECVVEGDLSLLQNAILNLGVNSRDAMPDGGTLHIRTENAELDEEYCRASGFELEPGPYLVLTVADTGSGMPKAVQDRVFEPFFTTKSRNRGTGLGLSVVYGTVKQHKGAILVYSEPGLGTEFHIYLPVATGKAPRQVSPEPVLTGTGCILVVDDERVVRVSAERLLRKLGYDVLVAEDGKQGVEMYREFQHRLDAVLLDMIMPRMDGEQAFRAILEIDPGARVVLSSGFTQNTRVTELLEAGVLGFVKKPYTRAELGRAIARALRSAAPESSPGEGYPASGGAH